MRSRTVTERAIFQNQSPVFSDGLAVECGRCLTKSLPGDCRRRLTRQGCRFWQGLCQSRDVGGTKPPRATPPSSSESPSLPLSAPRLHSFALVLSSSPSHFLISSSRLCSDSRNTPSRTNKRTPSTSLSDRRNVGDDDLDEREDEATAEALESSGAWGRGRRKAIG